MRILFTTIFGSGHFIPLIPYAREMSKRGHEVRIAAPSQLTSQIEAAGLIQVQVGRPSQEELDAFFSQVDRLPPGERLPFIRGGLFAGLLPRKALPVLREFVEEWQPHLIVREAGEYAAVIVAGLSGTPHARVSVSNGHSLTNAVEAVDNLRQEFGLEPDQGASLRQARAFSAFPASMEPPNGDGAVLPQFRVSPTIPSPSDVVPDWVSADDRPRVYMTFGTVMGSSSEAKSIFRAALDAVGRMNVTALMTTGPAMDVRALGTIPSNIVLRDFVPQNEVFPHVSAVLCHGGSGSVIGALAAGLPMVVTPIGADQPENAQAVASLGAGIAVATPDVDAIAAALQSVLTDPSFGASARRVASEIAAQPSVGDAVDEMLRHARPDVP